MADIFISYASGDRDFAKSLAGALEGEGWSVWWDRTILPGKTFDKAIEQALDEAKAVVVVWSSSSVRSDWVKEEIADAARKGVLIPAMIENVTIPLGFKRFQAADLSGWNADTSDPEFRNLVKAIDEIITRPSKTTRTKKQDKPQEDRRPKKEKNKKSWRIEIITKTDSTLSAKIFLENEVHLLQWKEHLLFGGTVSLDEEEISSSSSINREEHLFNISDGENTYTAVFLVVGALAPSFTLSIDGSTLLSGD